MGLMMAENDIVAQTHGEKIAAREAAMTRDVLAGKPVGQIMGADYENMLDD